MFRFKIDEIVDRDPGARRGLFVFAVLVHWWGFAPGLDQPRLRQGWIALPMPEFLKVEQKMMHDGGNDARLKPRLSKLSPFEVKRLVEFIRRGISVKLKMVQPKFSLVWAKLMAK